MNNSVMDQSMDTYCYISSNEERAYDFFKKFAIDVQFDASVLEGLGESAAKIPVVDTLKRYIKMLETYEQDWEIQMMNSFPTDTVDEYYAFLEEEAQNKVIFQGMIQFLKNNLKGIEDIVCIRDEMTGELCSLGIQVHHGQYHLHNALLSLFKKVNIC